MQIEDNLHVTKEFDSGHKSYLAQRFATAYRTGWIGAWDAFKAAITGDNRPQFTHSLEIRFLMKEEGGNIRLDNVIISKKGD